MTPRSALSAVLASAAIAAAGLAWPWPADRAPVGAIRGAQASTIRLAYPARPWYCAASTINCQSDVVAAWQPKGAASLNASYTDISGHGRTASVPAAPAGLVAPGLAAGGWVCAGQTALDTGVAPALGYSVAARVSAVDTADGRAGAVIGVQYPYGADSGRWYLIAGHPTAGVGRYYGYRASTTPGARIASGTLGLAGAQPYRDGAADGAAVGGTGGLPTLSAWLCALRYRGEVGGADAANFRLWGTVAAAAIWSRTLTSAEMAAVSAAMAAL